MSSFATSSPPEDRTHGRYEIEPLSARSAPLLEKLTRKRDGLSGHNPKALAVAAEALCRGHEAAWQRVPEIRCDRSARYRAQQLAAEHSLPVEDIVAIGLESDAGRAVALEIIGTIAEALGCDLVNVNSVPTKSLVAEAAEAARAVAQFAESVVLADEDNVITDDEHSDLSMKLKAARLQLEEAAARLRERRLSRLRIGARQ